MILKFGYRVKGFVEKLQFSTSIRSFCCNNLFKVSIAFFSVVLFLVAGYFVSLEYIEYSNEKKTRKLIEIVNSLDGNDKAGKLSLLKEAYTNASGNIKGFYAFKIADILLEEKDIDGAIGILKSVSEKYTVDRLIRDFAKYKVGCLLLAKGDTDSIKLSLKYFNAISKKSSVWEMEMEKKVIAEKLIGSNGKAFEDFRTISSKDSLIVLRPDDVENLKYFLNAK